MENLDEKHKKYVNLIVMKIVMFVALPNTWHLKERLDWVGIQNFD